MYEHDILSYLEAWRPFSQATGGALWQHHISEHYSITLFDPKNAQNIQNCSSTAAQVGLPLMYSCRPSTEKMSGICDI